MKHVDDFIDDPTSDRYAASWFESFRRPAYDKCLKPDDRKLFATYRGDRYRVTGCSRMGDVWLDPDFGRECGYTHRVDVSECSDWSPSSAYVVDGECMQDCDALGVPCPRGEAGTATASLSEQERPEK